MLWTFALFLYDWADRRKRPRQKGLPGPPGIPRVMPWGISTQFMWLKLKEWADLYGDVYQMTLMGADFIVISDEELARTLLVNMGNINSDRPKIQSLFDSKSEHGSKLYLPLMGRNDDWARQKKFTAAYLTEATVNQYYGIMEFEALRFLVRLLDEPENFDNDLEDMASKVMCTLTWDDHSFSRYCTQSAWGLLTQMSPAGPITNVLTPLWHLPQLVNPWKKAEIKRHDEQKDWWMERLLTGRRLMEEGKQRPCFTRKFLATPEDRTDITDDNEASCVLGMMALVGIFTVAGPLYYFLVSMIHHPEWQARCQEEIDRVCGGRQPRLADMEQLPVLRACIQETMRWKPNVPTGVAHEVEQPFIFRHVVIPKGTRILPLDFAFLRNPDKYPFPWEFHPERYLEPGWPTFREPLTKYPSIIGMSSFGWGRRQCLGMNLTQDELVVACGALMWAFNLKKKIDPVTGLEMEVPLDKCNSLLIVKPDKFSMAFEPRSHDRELQIRELWRKEKARDDAERAAFLAAAEARQKA